MTAPDTAQVICQKIRDKLQKDNRVLVTLGVDAGNVDHRLVEAGLLQLLDAHSIPYTLALDVPVNETARYLRARHMKAARAKKIAARLHDDKLGHAWAQGLVAENFYGDTAALLPVVTAMEHGNQIMFVDADLPVSGQATHLPLDGTRSREAASRLSLLFGQRIRPDEPNGIYLRSKLMFESCRNEVRRHRLGNYVVILVTGKEHLAGRARMHDTTDTYPDPVLKQISYHQTITSMAQSEKIPGLNILLDGYDAYPRVMPKSTPLEEISVGFADRDAVASKLGLDRMADPAFRVEAEKKFAALVEAAATPAHIRILRGAKARLGLKQ